jgi:putative sigma-54 modulation protein
MQLAATFRHMDASQAVKTYAEERLQKIRKYFQREPISAHATFAVERNHNHVAEFQITLPNGLVIQARETTEDMYSSIDLAGARLERQVRKWKERIRDHKPHGPSFSLRGRVLGAKTLEPPRRGAPPAKPRKEAKAHASRHPQVAVTAITPPKAPAIKVIKEQTFTVRALRVDDAVMQLNLLESEFFVFLDVDTKAVSVVYRRKDGNYGLIETGARLPAGPAGQVPGDG